MESYPGWISRHAGGWRWVEALILEDGADPCCLVQLAQDVIDVRLHGGHSDEQLGRYLIVGVVLRHEFEDFTFSAVSWSRDGGAGSGHCGGVGSP